MRPFCFWRREISSPHPAVPVWQQPEEYCDGERDISRSRNPTPNGANLLTPDQFRVLREHGTERAGTSPLNYEKRTGVYHCAACGQPLFESTTKYESGSGWPSFFRPLPNAVATIDRHRRTE